jgi:hypothetical protein
VKTRDPIQHAIDVFNFNPTTCSVEGCDRPVRYKKPVLCSAHYQRQWRGGDVHGIRAMRGDPRRWLESHVSHAADDCLIWPFSRSSTGYGDLRNGGKHYHAHRLMCQMAHGDPPALKLDAAHSCGNGHLACVNPRHLRWATRSENNQDAIEHRLRRLSFSGVQGRRVAA